MVPLDPSVFQTRQFEESASDVTRAALTSVFHGFPLPSSHGPGSHYPDTSSHSAPVNQAAFDLGVQDHSSTFLASDFSFDSDASDATFTPLDPTQDYVLRVSPDLEYGCGIMLSGDPVSFYVFIHAPGSTSMIFKGGKKRPTNQR